MKKLPTLHILNGDASLPAFEAAELPGQVLVWREILSEGPAIVLVPEDLFWQKRQKFITEAYGEAAEAYQKKVLGELPKLNAAGSFFEVVLWFDADLMCQLNLLYLLHRMYQLQPTSVYACTPPYSENLALLKAEQWQQLYQNRQQQTHEQLKIADTLWKLYAGPEPMALQEYLQQKAGIQPLLKQALQLHLSRFPECRSGLGLPEKLLLQLIQEGASTEEQLMKLYWQQYPEYGFGDWQLLQFLKRLQPELVNNAAPLTLTSFGNGVLQNEAFFNPIDYWLGGFKVKKNSTLCYNALAQRLEISS